MSNDIAEDVSRASISFMSTQQEQTAGMMAKFRTFSVSMEFSQFLDLCALGMQMWSKRQGGGLVYKQTKFITNSPEFAKILGT